MRRHGEEAVHRQIHDCRIMLPYANEFPPPRKQPQKKAGSIVKRNLVKQSKPTPLVTDNLLQLFKQMH